METNELMFKDWVMLGRKKHRCYNICGHTNDVMLDNGVLTNVSNLKPIPLTPEILEKNGFKKDKYGQMVLNEELGTSEIYIVLQDGDECYWWVVNNELIAKIRYVHQLQHTLRLCRIEKEIIL